jgi:hypothetical protein
MDFIEGLPKVGGKSVILTVVDEGTTNRPSIFTYLVFGPGGIVVEGIVRPMKIAAWRGPGAKLGVQAKIRRVRAGLVLD